MGFLLFGMPFAFGTRFAFGMPFAPFARLARYYRAYRMPNAKHPDFVCTAFAHILIAVGLQGQKTFFCGAVRYGTGIARAILVQYFYCISAAQMLCQFVCLPYAVGLCGRCSKNMALVWFLLHLAMVFFALP